MHMMRMTQSPASLRKSHKKMDMTSLEEKWKEHKIKMMSKKVKINICRSVEMEVDSVET